MTRTAARPHRRPGGRQAARLATHIEASPFLTRTLKPFEVRERRGHRDHRAQRRHDPRGGRRDRARLPRRARAVRRPRAPTSTASGCGSRAGCAARSCRRPRRPSTRSTRATRRTTCRSAATPPSSRPTTARRSCTTSTRGRRYATLADFENFVKLAYLSPNLHHSGGTVCEPVDIPVNKRHLDMVYAHLRYSDKPFMGSVTAGSRAADSVELARIGVRRRPRRSHGDDEPHQRVVAAGVGRDDARGRAGVRRRQPGDDHHAVHPRRRDGAGDDRGRRGADARRSARRA